MTPFSEHRPPGRRRLARAGDRPPERRADRSGPRPLRNTTSPSSTSTAATGTTRRPTAANGRWTRTTSRSPSTATAKSFDYALILIHGTPGEDGRLQGYLDMMEHSLLLLPDDLVGRHLRQNHHQTHRWPGSGFNARPRAFPAAATVALDRVGNRPHELGLAAIRKTQRQRFSSFGVTKVQRAADILPRRRRRGIRPGRRNPDRGVHPRPRNGLRRTDRRRQGVPAPDHGDPFPKKEFFDYPGQIHRRAIRTRSPRRTSHPEIEAELNRHDALAAYKACRCAGRRARGFHRHARRQVPT